MLCISTIVFQLRVVVLFAYVVLSVRLVYRVIHLIIATANRKFQFALPIAKILHIIDVHSLHLSKSALL